jgi:hypothetical protein
MKSDGDLREFYQPVFAEMKRAGRKVTTNKEAGEVLRQMMILDGWTLYGPRGRAVPPIEVDGPYRRRPNTFSAGVYGWSCGDDLGLEVDAEGYAVGLLGGHVK